MSGERNWSADDPAAKQIIDGYAEVMGRFLFEFLRLEDSIELTVTGLYEVDDLELRAELSDALFRGRTAKPKVDMLQSLVKTSTYVDQAALGELVRECRKLIELRNDLAHRLPRIQLSPDGIRLHFDAVPGKDPRHLDDIVAANQRMPALGREILETCAPELAWRRHKRQQRTHRELEVD